MKYRTICRENFGDDDKGVTEIDMSAKRASCRKEAARRRRNSANRGRMLSRMACMPRKASKYGGMKPSASGSRAGKYL